MRFASWDGAVSDVTKEDVNEWFNLDVLARKLDELGPQDVCAQLRQKCAGVRHDTLQGEMKEVEQWVRRSSSILKKPFMSMRGTLVQLASQEPANSRLVRAADEALRQTPEDVIEWTNKSSPSVREHEAMQSTNKLRSSVLNHGSLVWCLAFKPDDPNVLVTGSRGCKVWDLRTGTCKSTLNVNAGFFGVQCVTFNGTGDTIVAGCCTGNIFFIDTATSQVREPPLRGHRYTPSLP